MWRSPSVEQLGGCPTPTTRQASGGDRHLNFYEVRDNLLNNLTAQLNTRDLIQMNQRVELEGAKPAVVAADWLDNHPVNR
jgi:Substrate binding domain of ABC-type glycine betaine transport system